MNESKLTKSYTKNILLLFSGNLVAKILGILRQLFIVGFLGTSIKYSEILALFVAPSLIGSFFDQSIINSTLVPLWKKNSKVIIPYNFIFISVLFLLFGLIYLYNVFVLDGIGSMFDQIIIPFFLFLTILNNFGFSILSFYEKYKEFRFVTILNAVVFYISIFSVYFVSYEGVVVSRFIAILVSILTCFYYLKGLKIKLLKTPVVSFISREKIGLIFSTNMSMFYGLIINLYFSLNHVEYMAHLVYANIIAMSFYTLFSKNIGIILLKNRLSGMSFSFKFIFFYFSISALFVCAIVIGKIYSLKFLLSIQNKLSYIDLQIIFNITIILIINYIILGFSDLYNQKFLNKIIVKNVIFLNIIFFILTIMFNLFSFHFL